MSDAIVHSLVRARIAEISADAAACRAVRRSPEAPAVPVPAATARPGRNRASGLTTHGALRDYLTAI